ncbi:MAG: methionyl-tRNA formyltransferase [Anaerolineales bacterium]|nr:methionyl-tRNA formyltransferase [Anaerolineales bacterium]
MTSTHRIVFMGSPEFAVPSLRTLHKNYPVVGVITQPDRPSGRGRKLTPPPVKVLAAELGLPVLQPESLGDQAVFGQLQAWKPDFIVVAAYGQILRQEVLDLPPFGCINVHASLLPRWRGAAPINAAILAGDEEAGVTIMKMDAGVDTGPTYSRRSLPVESGDTPVGLSPKLAELGAALLVESLPGILSGELQPQPQPEDEATYAPMLKKEDGRLDFNLPAKELERRVRAYQPWPGTYFEWEGGSLKVLQAHVEFVFTYVIQPPGSRLVQQGCPAVFCGDNALLVLDEVQPPGKKAMPGKAFLSGARGWQEQELDGK